MDVSSSSDGSLTKVDIQGMTPSEIEDLKDTAIDEAFLYRQTTLAGISGVRSLGLWDLMMSRIKNVGNEITPQSVGENKSYFLPFILREQEDYINVNSFILEAGGANPNAGEMVGGVYHRTDTWRLTVTTPSYGVSELALTSPVKNPQRYFLPGSDVYVLTKNGNAGQTLTFRVVDAEFGGTSGNTGNDSAYVIVEPKFTEGYLTGDDLAAYQPTNGLVQLGVNSVSDYESWAYNHPSELSRRMLAFWPQTSRFTRQWDDAYEDYLGQIMAGKVNPYLQRFRELPLAEQNRQQYARYQRNMLNSFFYGEAINENQTVEGYRNLPKVNDPRGVGSFLEYKCDALGLRTQLNATGRVIDQNSQALNLNTLEEQLYILKRHREVNGGSVDDIDVLTDKSTANRIKTLFAGYYQQRYGIAWQRELQSGKVSYGDLTVWNYNTYELDEAQVRLNVITEPFFADHKAQFAQAASQVPGASGLSNRGNCLWFIDWSDVQFGVTKVGSRTSTTPHLETDPDYKHVIAANTTKTEMESVSWTPIINDPRKSLVWENFSDEVPSYTWQDAAPTS
jgi:hypothetical protein